MDWLDAGQMETVVEAVFDETRERVAGHRRTRYHDLVIAEEECDAAQCPGGLEEVERVLVAAASDHLDRALALDGKDVAAFLARARSLAEPRNW